MIVQGLVSGSTRDGCGFPDLEVEHRSRLGDTSHCNPIRACGGRVRNDGGERGVPLMSQPG